VLTLWGSSYPATTSQKKGNNKSGSEMARDKEAVAAMMRQKQAAGAKQQFPSSTCALLNFCNSGRKESCRSGEEMTRPTFGGASRSASIET
jgi:hypothetical protein